MSHSDSYSAAPTHHHAFQNSLTAIINAEFVACLYRHRTALRSQTRQDAHSGAKNLAAGFLPASFEPIHLSRGINQTLLAGIKRVAIRTNIHTNIRRSSPCFERSSTSTLHVAYHVGGMNVRFHFSLPPSQQPYHSIGLNTAHRPLKFDP